MSTTHRSMLAGIAVAAMIVVASLAGTATPVQAFGLTFAPGTSQAADSATTAAIKAVVQKADQEQQDAFAQNDPTLMRDTATSSYYAQMVQTNQDLAANGVTAIRLIALQWGPVTLQNATTAQAITYETWRTTYDDGSVDQSRDQNVYTLVQGSSGWLIQSDEQPGATGSSPAPSTSPVGPSGTIPPISTPGRGNTSENWSGYAATGGTFTGVTGTWTVPQSQGSGSTTGGRNVATSAIWVGIGGVTSRDLIQAGTDEISLGSGRVGYQAWIEMLPQASRPIPLTVNPGDSITVSIDEQANSQWLIAFKDNTTGQTYQRTVDYQSSLSSADWVVEAPSAGRAVLPLDNFGTVQFTGGSAIENGKTVTLSQAGAQAITMIDAYGDPIATPSALTGNGQGFTVTESNNSGSAGSGFSPFPVGRGYSSGFPELPWWLTGGPGG